MVQELRALPSVAKRETAPCSAACAEVEMSETPGRSRQATSIHARRRDALLRRRRASGVAFGVAFGIAGLTMSVFAYALTVRSPHPQVAQHYVQSQTAPSGQTTGQNRSPPAALPPAPAEKIAPLISR